MRDKVIEQSDAPSRFADSLERVAEFVVENSILEDVGIYTVDDRGEWRRRASTAGYPDEISKQMRELPDRSRPRIVDDLRDSSVPATDPWIADAGIRSVVAIPMTTSGREAPTGWLIGADSRPNRGSDADLEALEDLTRVAGDLVDAEEARRRVAETRRKLSEHREKQNELIEELKRSNQRLEQFAYVASHDLQEPLRMITGFLGLLEDEYAGKLAETADEYIDFAVDGAERMKDMIDGLLQYSRMWSSDDPFVPLDTAEIFDRVRREVLATHDDTEVTIEQTGELPVVYGRKSQIRRVFSNLLKNAVVYGSEPVEFEVWCEEDEEGDFEFSIRDDGPGVPEEHREDIFDIFVSGTRRGDEQSTGIGLAICKTIVEEHGGRIWVDPAPDQGSIFRFTIDGDLADS